LQRGNLKADPPIFAASVPVARRRLQQATLTAGSAGHFSYYWPTAAAQRSQNHPAAPLQARLWMIAKAWL